MATPLIVSLIGCATMTGTRDLQGLGPKLAQRVELTDVPFHPQDANQCGPAALATVLGSAHIVRTPAQLQSEVYLPRRHGSLQSDMLGAARRSGALPYVLEPDLQALLLEVAAGHPVVVLQNLGFPLIPQWHYAVVVGFDRGSDEVFLRSGLQRRQVMTMNAFDRSWAKAGRWAFVALAPDALPSTARETEFVEAAITFEQVSPANAQMAYRAALQAWPQDLLARLASGNASYRQHRLEEARDAYRQATDDHPESPDAWNNLAQVLSDLAQPQQALAAAQRAVDLGGPRRSVYRATYQEIEQKQSVEAVR